MKRSENDRNTTDIKVGNSGEEEEGKFETEIKVKGIKWSDLMYWVDNKWWRNVTGSLSVCILLPFLEINIYLTPS